MSILMLRLFSEGISACLKLDIKQKLQKGVDGICQWRWWKLEGHQVYTIGTFSINLPCTVHISRNVLFF